MKNHINLIILTPGHSLMGSYVKSLINTLGILSEKGITWMFANDYASHVADAREITISGTRNNNPSDSRPFEGRVTYDKLLWIDSDIAWTPEDVLKLYYSDKDIISGAYLLADGSVTVYKKMFKESLRYEEVLQMDEPIQIEGAGFGFICIKQGVFEVLSRPWFQSVTKEIEFNDEKYSFPIMGEDLSWCARVLDLGYEIWFDPTVRVTHHKTMKLTWEGIRP